MTNWYAVYTKPYSEKLTASRLRQLNIEVFLPQVRQEQMVCNVARLVVSPLFPRYLFVRFCPLLSNDAVRNTPCVLRVLGTRQFPVPLQDEIIDSIRAKVQADGYVELVRRPFKSGDKVTIDQGLFSGWMGRVEREWDDGKRVSILLEAVEQARLLIEKQWVFLSEGQV